LVFFEEIFLIINIHRSDRRFVVKRYIERVLANSFQWQQLAKSSFLNIEPIAQAYTMTENEVKLMHHIFSWHLNGTLTFPIIAGRKKDYFLIILFANMI
jgi:hypothetical protein